MNDNTIIFNYNKDTKEYILDRKNYYKINKRLDERLDYKSRCEKALDKLYCYGEVFDSKILQEFQKDLENILQGEDKE